MRGGTGALGFGHPRSQSAWAARARCGGGASVEAGRGAPPQVAREATRLPGCVQSGDPPQRLAWELWLPAGLRGLGRITAQPGFLACPESWAAGLPGLGPLILNVCICRMGLC